MSRLNNKKGFTLIELVIVLAIAALILAAVLIAVGGAQRSRRDTQRKNDAGTISSQLEQYASNNGGGYPTTTAGLTAFQSSYVSTLTDPQTGNAYTLTYTTASSAPTVGTMDVASSAKCNGQLSTASSNARQYAVVVGLESQGSVCFGN